MHTDNLSRGALQAQKTEMDGQLRNQEASLRDSHTAQGRGSAGSARSRTSRASCELHPTNGRCLEKQNARGRSNRGSVNHSLQMMNFSANGFQLFVVVRGQGAITLLLEVSNFDLKLGFIKTLYLVMDMLVDS